MLAYLVAGFQTDQSLQIHCVYHADGDNANNDNDKDVGVKVKWKKYYKELHSKALAHWLFY